MKDKLIIQGDWRKATEKHPLRPAIEEFSYAIIAYKEMVGIPEFNEFEKSWKLFLHHIDRVWNKTHAICRNKKGWQKIESKIKSARKKDPLLRYIIQARNIDEHSIADLSKDWESNFEGKVTGFNIELTWKPWDRPLLPINNRGVVFDPPTSHLGKDIGHLKQKGKSEPRIVAELALDYYCDLLNMVSTELFGNNY